MRQPGSAQTDAVTSIEDLAARPWCTVAGVGKAKLLGWCSALYHANGGRRT